MYYAHVLFDECDAKRTKDRQKMKSIGEKENAFEWDDGYLSVPFFDSND